MNLKDQREFDQDDTFCGLAVGFEVELGYVRRMTA